MRAAVSRGFEVPLPLVWSSGGAQDGLQNSPSFSESLSVMATSNCDAVPIDDTLALLVGRIILAFGRFDQQVWHSIIMLQNNIALVASRTGDDTWLDDVPIDPRFTYRLRHLRRLAAKLSQGNGAYLGRYDAWQNAVKELERERGNFAHGMILLADPGHFRIYEQRAMNDLMTNYRKKAAALSKERARALREGLLIPYSREQMEALPKRISDAEMQMYRLRSEAVKLSEPIGDPPAHGCSR